MRFIEIRFFHYSVLEFEPKIEKFLVSVYRLYFVAGRGPGP
jgi:hypothetical protein